MAWHPGPGQYPARVSSRDFRGSRAPPATHIPQGLQELRGCKRTLSFSSGQEHDHERCITTRLPAGLPRAGRRGEPGIAAAAADENKAAARAYDLQLAPVPLPFDPKALKGLSEKLVQSHWENNYGGAVKALNTVQSRLTQALASADTPAYVYNGLKREQLLRTGSVVLHEFYFENLGGDGKAGAGLRSRIADSFGTFDAWEKEFRTIGNGLGGGSGWVVLGYNEIPGKCWRTTGWPTIRPMRSAMDQAGAGDGHVRACLPDGLRRRGREVHRRVLRQPQLGRGGAASLTWQRPGGNAIRSGAARASPSFAVAGRADGLSALPRPRRRGRTAASRARAARASAHPRTSRARRHNR